MVLVLFSQLAAAWYGEEGWMPLYILFSDSPTFLNILGDFLKSHSIGFNKVF